MQNIAFIQVDFWKTHAIKSQREFCWAENATVEKCPLTYKGLPWWCGPDKHTRPYHNIYDSVHSLHMQFVFLEYEEVTQWSVSVSVDLQYNRQLIHHWQILLEFHMGLHRMLQAMLNTATGNGALRWNHKILLLAEFCWTASNESLLVLEMRF